MFSLFHGPVGIYETLRFLEEKGHAGLFSCDLATQTMTWSPGMFLLMRVDPGTVELTYDLFKSLIHSEDRFPSGSVDEFYRNGTTFSHEFRLVPPNGRLRYVRCTGEYIVNPAGEPTKLIGVIFDITPQKEDAKALTKKFNRLRDMLDGLVPILWRARSDGFVTDMVGWNDLTGQTEAEFAGSGWLDAIHAEDRSATADAWNAAIKNLMPLEIEPRLQLFDGSHRRYRIHAKPIFSTGGKLLYWNGVCIDIHTTQRSAAETSRQPPITGVQVRAARGILKWSVRDLAQTSGISEAIIRRVEEFDGAAPRAEKSVDAIRKTLVGAGVELLFFRPTTNPVFGWSPMANLFANNAYL